METKHSRAPWSIEPSSLGLDGKPLWYYIIDADGKIVATTWSKNQDGNAISDARLIAAAPEMFEAMKIAADVFRVYEQIHAVKGSQDKAERNRNYAECFETIIAKIEGGAQ